MPEDGGQSLYLAGELSVSPAAVGLGFDEDHAIAALMMPAEEQVDVLHGAVRTASAGSPDLVARSLEVTGVSSGHRPETCRRAA
jgi:hypothetical protein